MNKVISECEMKMNKLFEREKTEKEVVKNNLIKLAKKIEDSDSKADKIIASNIFIKALVKNFEDENSCSVKVKL